MLTSIFILLYCSTISSIEAAASVKIFTPSEFADFVLGLGKRGRPAPDKCSFNPWIIDPYNINATRKNIRQCADNSESCYHAVNSKYRTMDGKCNNLQHPSWGKTEMCLQRILPFDYSDDMFLPRISCTGKELPNPRHISNVFHNETAFENDGFSTHFMEWGQIVAHDLSNNGIFRTIESGNKSSIDCCTNGPVINDKCMSVPVPESEQFYTKYGVSCLNFPRTVPCQQYDSDKRLHWNRNTAFHDLSPIYGSDDRTASKLRSMENGMLKSENNAKSGPMLPTVGVEEHCISPPNDKICYYAGDTRTNRTPFLVVIHTFLFRHHNVICQKLKEVNPHWNDEQLYHEARRINTAVAQYITYAKYLPNILGNAFEKAGIGVLPTSKYKEYNPGMDPSTTDEYAAFAARYGHTIVPGPFTEIDPVTEQKRTVRLRDTYYNPYIFKNGEYDSIAKGMTVDQEMKVDLLLSDDIRNFLFRRVYLNERYGDDLAALSIVRGRDHAIPGYTYYLAHFFNITIQVFSDLRKLMPIDSLNMLEKIYESVHDIDVYSAGLAEYHMPGAVVGPTFGAVLIDQYRRTKYGDRYWFEHGNQAGSFTPEQLADIKRSSLSRVLCETTKITEIQLDAFRPPSLTNPVIPCDKIPKLNFCLWKENLIQ